MLYHLLLGLFYAAITVPSVTRCRCRRCCGHRCAGGVRQWRRVTVATPGEWQCKTARRGEWAQHFSNASCYISAYVVETEEAAWHHVDPRILKTSWNNLEKLVGRLLFS